MKNTVQVVDDFKNLVTFNKSIKIYYGNIRSIVKPGKFEELQCVLKALGNNIDIIVLTETWIKSEAEARRFGIANYSHYYNFRSAGRGGGVSVFVHNNLKHCHTEDTNLDGNHFLWVHLEKLSLDIGVVYRKPDVNIEKFLEEYSSQINKRSRAVVIGDLNFNLLSSDRGTTLYKDSIKENGYKIVNNINVKFCTRETESAKTILDHVCTNLKNNYFHLAILESPISDHKQLYIEIKKYKQTPKIKMQYEAVNYEKLYNAMKIDNKTNESNIYEDLEEKLIRNIRLNTIKKHKILNPPQRDWINKEIIEEINSRNILWKKHKQNPKNNDIKNSYIMKRNEVSKIIQKNKTTYYLQAFQKCRKKPAKSGV
jgi:hypothetical protein